ncbi:MAG: hypothetical protein U1C96_12015 [Gallionella sp.]|nr:hypothetical protein [Gallionella sp.]
MKRSIVFLFIAAITMNAYAADERDASRIVKKYSEAVACQLEGVGDYQKNQYKAVKINSGEADLGGLGAMFVVYWEGDLGCAGGNGTVLPKFTVVEHTGFSSADPVVITDYKFPEIDLVRLTSISAKNGQLIIKGVTYGPKDRQNSPTKAVSYALKLVNNEFVKQ